MLSSLAIFNYRSIRDMVIRPRQLNIVTGANGSGKSNLYRALRLLAEIAQGHAISSLAREGGIESTLWAGPEVFSRSVLRGDQPVQGTVKRGPISLRLGFTGDEFSYAIDLGLPAPSDSQFAHDPEIKRECIWNGGVFRPAALLVDRRGSVVRTRSEDGQWNTITQNLAAFDSMMSHCADPRSTPEILLLREQMRRWRFYDQLRTDPEAPARLPQVGTHTPVLSNDGADLAAAIQTIREIGDVDALDSAVEDAFPGASVTVTNTGGRFELEMEQNGLLRPLTAAELSDGTLRYMLWVAALLTPRPPGLLVLNEPETSLHTDLLPALGRLVAHAARNSQVLVVSHAATLISALRDEPDCNSITLDKTLGETKVLGTDKLGGPSWSWPPR